MVKTFEELYEALAADYSAATGLSLLSGSDMDIRFRALSAQLHSLWVQADWVQRQSFPQTATGQMLDYHAETRALSRLQATKAHGTLRFTVPAALSEALTVPAGTVCRSAGGVEFLTDAAVTLAAGALFCEAAATAREAGSAGNVPAGSITTMTQPPTGIAGCTNRAAFSGGSDEETDDALRERLLASFSELPNGTNAAYYRALVSAVDGVAAVHVTPRARGVGTVNIVFTVAGGVPTAAKISEISALVNAEREICVNVQVAAPTTTTVSPTIALQVAEGYSFSAVSTVVRSAVAGYFDGKLLGQDVLLAKLGSLIYAVPGVKNYRISAPTADVAVADNVLPVLGTLTISEMGA